MQQRLDIEYTIRFDGNWHVGSGFRTVATDRLIQRLGGRDGSAFVPGSQVKGVLRHTCERLAGAFGLPSVDPHTTSPSKQQRLVECFHLLARTDVIIDRLFGTRFQGECLFVDNAIPSKSGHQDDRLELPGTSSTVRTRTGIDRLTRTIKDGHLFSTEQAPPDVVLNGRIRARHPAGVLTQDGDGVPFEYSLLLVGVLSIDKLGGDKSSGLGCCSVAVTKIRWNGKDISADECLRSFHEEEWAELLIMIREEGQQ